jgi:hypothetical protein
VQAPSPEGGGGSAEGKELGVGERVAGRFSQVVRSSHDLAGVDHHGAHRHLAGGRRAARFFDS